MVPVALDPPEVFHKTGGYHTIQDTSVATLYCATVAKFGKGGALKMLSHRGPQVQILSVAPSRYGRTGRIVLIVTACGKNGSKGCRRL